MPIAANQASWTLGDVAAVLQADAADVIVTGLHAVGGIANLLKAAAAGCHAMSVIPAIDDGSQTFAQHWAADIVSGATMALVGGAHVVPTAPGLGVTVDPAVVREFAERYRTRGPFVVVP